MWSQRRLVRWRGGSLAGSLLPHPTCQHAVGHTTEFSAHPSRQLGSQLQVFGQIRLMPAIQQFSCFCKQNKPPYKHTVLVSVLQQESTCTTSLRCCPTLPQAGAILPQGELCWAVQREQRGSQIKAEASWVTWKASSTSSLLAHMHLHWLLATSGAQMFTHMDWPGKSNILDKQKGTSWFWDLLINQPVWAFLLVSAASYSHPEALKPWLG